MGSVKNVAKIDVYVKDEHCEVSLREIIKHLKSESLKRPIVKSTLGKWSFLQSDLLPLLVFHDRDKKLAFLTLMLLVQLTELPSQECDGKMRLEILSQLARIKESFLEPRVISTLMVHLADCLKVEEKQKKHNDMIELIFVIFKQLLSIPES